MALLAALALLLPGCAMLEPQPQPGGKEKILWPAPPEQPRFRFAGILRSAADVVPDSEETRLQRQLTGLGEQRHAPVIDKPSGIAVRSGLVYVAEPAARAITVFDLQRRKLFRFGLREPNALERPQAVAVDHTGFVYVLDSGLRKVMVFDNIGLFVRAFGLGTGFSNPVALAVSPDGSTLYVVDRGDLANEDHKVVAFSAEGRERFRLGPRGSAEGRFNIPLAAAVAGDGTLYVADTGNFRIQAFDAQGRFKQAFGGPGAEPGRFSRPRAIALDPDGNVYVADAGFNNVQIFNPQGQLLMPLGGLNRDPGPGHYALIAGIAVDEDRRLYVNDHYFKKIEVFERLSEEQGRRLASEQ